MAPWHMHNFNYNQRYNNNNHVHMGRWRKQNNNNNHHNVSWVPHNSSNSHYNYSHHIQPHYNNNRAPMMTPPTAWFCSKCGLDHHNINMITCRRPGCGGHNPAKPPIDVPTAK
eukprot:12401734-Karenia_brevis.AAC.1